MVYLVTQGVTPESRTLFNLNNVKNRKKATSLLNFVSKSVLFTKHKQV